MANDTGFKFLWFSFPPTAAKPRYCDSMKDYFDKIRTLGTEVQDLTDVLKKVRSGDITLTDYQAYVKKTRSDIQKLIDDVSGNMPPGFLDPPIINHIVNVWELVQNNPILADPPPSPALANDVQLKHLTMLDEQFRKLNYYVGYLTIPCTLEDWLSADHAGYYIPFHQVFDDELSSAEDRTKLLKNLAWAPDAVKGGLVDPASGLIYRYSRSPWHQFFAFVGTLVAIALSVGLIYILPQLPTIAGLGSDALSNYPLKDANPWNYLFGWLVLLGGIVAHILVDTAKRIQSQTELPPIFAIGDFFKVIDARLGDILIKLLIAFLGFLALALTNTGGTTPQTTSAVSYETAFLLGYSLDSFVGLFGATFEKRAAAQVTSMQKQLGLEANP